MENVCEKIQPKHENGDNKAVKKQCMHINARDTPM